MGVVVRALDVRMERDVAIKFLRAPNIEEDTAARRFEREVLLSKELNHHHVVQVYDFGRQRELLYLVMEYLEGEELKDLISRGPLSTHRVIDISLQLLEGLAEAHARSIIHRDLKPGNIFVTRDRKDRDFVKLLDFGIAKSIESDDVDLTSAGNVCGTPGYMSPETFLKANVAPHTDIYAVGLIMLEMLFGQPVVAKASPAQMMFKHLQMEVVLPERLRGTEFGKVLRRAVDKIPQRRFKHADEMLVALEAVRESTSNVVLTSAEISDCFVKMQEGIANGPTTPYQAYESPARSERADPAAQTLAGKLDSPSSLDSAIGEDWEISSVSIHEESPFESESEAGPWQPDRAALHDEPGRSKEAESGEADASSDYVRKTEEIVAPEPPVDYREHLTDNTGSSISAIPAGTQEIPADSLNRVMLVLLAVAIAGGALLYFGLQNLPDDRGARLGVPTDVGTQDAGADVASDDASGDSD